MLKIWYVNMRAIPHTRLAAIVCAIQTLAALCAVLRNQGHLIIM